MVSPTVCPVALNARLIVRTDKPCARAIALGLKCRGSTRTRPQVVDLGFGPLDALLMAGARRGVAQGGHVVVAVTRPDGVGFAGLAQLFLCVLAHRLQ
jgi:hypothetical protein